MNDRATGPSSDTSRQLVEGTLEVLRTHGLQGATSRAIARASGVNLAGITYHFGSKDELVAQALLEAFRSWLAPAIELLGRPGEHPAVRMIAAVQALQDSFERSRDLLPVYLEALVHAPRTDSLRRGIEETLAQIRGFLLDQIAELRTTGFLPAWVEPEAMATLLLATANGLALHAALEPEAVDHHAVAAQAVQLLLSARAIRGSQPA
jgi:AcrR family transcriptional regulator